MAKKAFEKVPYDPIQVELLREAVKRAPSHAELAATSVVPAQPMPAPAPAIVPPPVAPRAPTLVPEATATSFPIGLGKPVSPPERIGQLGIAKRFMLTRAEDAELKAFLGRLERRAGTRVQLSSFVRAAMQLAVQFEEAIAEELASTAPGRLPSNHDAVAMSMYDEWCTRCLLEAVRKSNGQGKPRS